MSLNKSDIEWTEFTANPIRGRCPHYGTPKCGTYCYAEPIRNKQGLGDPAFYSKVLDAIKTRKKPSTFFLGSMIDMFADEIPEAWLLEILKVLNDCRQHTFILLTKNPDRMSDMFSLYHGIGVDLDFRHVWLGETVTRGSAGGKTQFVSAEPLLGPVFGFASEITSHEGIIVGAGTFRDMSKAYVHGKKYGLDVIKVDREYILKPRLEWVRDIIDLADEYGVRVFLKDNLLEVYPDLPRRRELAWNMKGGD